MANRVFQNVVYQMKDAIDRVVGVVDETGAVIACSELGQIGEMREGFAVARLTAGDAFEKDGYAYHQFSNAKHNDYAVFVEGNDPTAAQFASLLSISLQSIKQYHDEKFDKTNFIKNVVLDNILPGDIYAKARELHFVSDVQRVVLLIRVTSGNDISAYDVVSSLFPDKQKDFVFNISETDTVLVKEIRPDNNTRDMEKLAASIVDTLQGEHYIKAVVGIGTPISNIKDLASSFKEAQIAIEVGKVFDTEKYVNKWPAKRHDHYLIPAGTVHCSGAGAMVLEISATPSIFTFKLWDWGRLGLDGLPRPINIGHGSKVIQWERQTEFVRNHLINQVEMVAEGDGWREERTGLHENEFIETRRHWFTDIVPHNTNGGVQVLNVIKGDELIVESPTGAFEPFIVHYAETFIIPAWVGEYTIRPYGSSVGKYCGTIKAYVRFRQ